MSDQEENDDNKEDEKEEEQESTNNRENRAKIDINAWRKRRSIVNANNPLLRRRLSQGEKLCVYYKMELLKYI